MFPSGSFYCRRTFSGEEYIGHIAIDYRGYPCKPWSETKFKYDRYFPYDGSAAAAKNYCRNPDQESMPWCYVEGLSKKSYGPCHIPLCSGVIELPQNYQGGITGGSEYCYNYVNQFDYTHNTNLLTLRYLKLRLTFYGIKKNTLSFSISGTFRIHISS